MMYKRTHLSIGLSIVLSSYLYAASPDCPLSSGRYLVTNNNSNWIDSSLRSCLYHASQDAGTATVAFNSNMSITLASDAEIAGTNHLIIDGEGQDIIISGGGHSKIFDSENTNQITLKDLTLRDANATRGAALEIENPSLVTIDNVKFLNNNSTTASNSKAAAIYAVSDSKLDIKNSSFIGNSSLYDAAIYLEQNVELNVSNSIFSSNNAVYASGHDGLSITANDNSVLNINNSKFYQHPHSSSSATSIIYVYNDVNLSVNNSEFYENTSASIIAEGTHNSNIQTIENSIFRNNSGAYRLFYIKSKRLDIKQSVFTDNVYESSIYYSGDTLNIENSKFLNNTTDYCSAIDISNTTTANIVNTTISNNSAFMGSALCLSNTNINIINSTLTQNLVHYDSNMPDYSGTIYTYNSDITIDSCTIANNSAVSSALMAGIHDGNSDSNITIKNSIFTDNKRDGVQKNTNRTLIALRYSIVGTDVNANLELFVQKGIDPKLDILKDNGGDTPTHALKADSPARDVGNTSQTTDQRGKSRDVTPDIGAYEHQKNILVPIYMFLL